MLEVDSSPTGSSQHPFEKAAFAPDQAALDPFRQAAFSPNLSGPIVEIPTLYTNNQNIETRGFYFAQSPTAQLYRAESPTVGRLIAKDAGGNIHDWASVTYVNSSGLAVSDRHAVADANGPIQVISNGVVHQAKVLGVDVKTDLALLQVMPATSGETFTPVHFGSSQMTPGDHVTILGLPRKSNNLHVSSGTYVGDLRAGQLPMKDGLPPGEDPNRNLKEVATNVQTGNSGGPGFRDNGDAIGIVSSTNQGTLGMLTPSEDVVAFIQRTQHDLPSGLAQTVIGSDNNYYSRALAFAPDWMTSALAGFGYHQPATSVWGDDSRISNWQNYLRNFSIRQLFS